MPRLDDYPFHSLRHFKDRYFEAGNVEEDHLDFFKDLADIEHSFHAFADLVPQRGYIISNADDAGARDSVKGLQHPRCV